MTILEASTMSKFPARYTQLPNFEHEYAAIINRLNEGMYKTEVEDIIGTIKGSVIKNKYKHRTHLENLGLFKTNDSGFVIFSDVLKDIKFKKISLKKGLFILVKNNSELENIFKIIYNTGFFDKRINKKKLALILYKEYFSETAPATIERYLNQLISLFEIIGTEYLSMEVFQKDNIVSLETLNEFLQQLERFYIENVGEYGEVLALEKICMYFKNKFDITEDRVIEFLGQVFLDEGLKYKYTFVMLPVWSTESSAISIQGTLFTHLIIEFE